MIRVPHQFTPDIRVEYPPHNKILFEDYMMSSGGVDGRREYLPVQWTAFHVNNDYGKRNQAFNELQRFIDRLPRDRSYYTVVQYDDGCLVDFKDLDILVFNMSDGDNGCYPMPLLCEPKPYEFPDRGRDIFASFIGGMTHKIRRDMFRVAKDSWNMYLSSESHHISDYCRMMSRSIFALCPRGYGKNSFRIAEAMQYGAIPVYISDSFVMPFNEDFNEFGILVHERDLHKLDEILNNIPARGIWDRQKAITEYYQKLYTYDGAKSKIAEIIC